MAGPTFSRTRRPARPARPAPSPPVPKPGAAFVAHCVDLLSSLGPVQARRMFSGHGLYADGLMVGLVAHEQLYLKTDAQSLPDWQAAGGRAFTVQRRQGDGLRSTALSYWTPPDDALESPALMQPWARRALEAAWRSQVRAQTRSRTATARKTKPLPRARGG